MTQDQSVIEAAIRTKFVEIVKMLGEDPGEVSNDDLLPATGMIDSAGLLELIAWYEDHFDISVAQNEFTIDNLGSITLMAQYVLRRKCSS